MKKTWHKEIIKRTILHHPEKANPSDTGQDKATIKEGKTTDELKNEEEIIEKHTNDGEIPPHLQRGANPNRNTDKPDIDKPAYGSSK